MRKLNNAEQAATILAKGYEESGFKDSFEKMWNESDKDLNTKIQLSKALVENIDALIQDWQLAKNAILEQLKQAEKQM